jgi:DNA-binding SARP family transcriptional activator
VSAELSSDEPVLRIQTLGGCRVWRQGGAIDPTAWGREKALHLFQFLVTKRRGFLHREEIIDQLWPELDAATGGRDFRVALNAVHRVIEPERARRVEPTIIRRQGLAYGLDPERVWIDADEFEALIAAGNRALPSDAEGAVQHYQAAAALYAGEYLPDRRYEDWTTAERERLHTLALGTLTTLANLLVERNPLESLRLTQRVLALAPVWEEAYRVQMRAYMAQGSRAQALRTYEQCVKVLEHEFGVEPLPETQALHQSIRQKR